MDRDVEEESGFWRRKYLDLGGRRLATDDDDKGDAQYTIIWGQAGTYPDYSADIQITQETFMLQRRGFTQRL